MKTKGIRDEISSAKRNIIREENIKQQRDRQTDILLQLNLKLDELLKTNDELKKLRREKQSESLEKEIHRDGSMGTI